MIPEGYISGLVRDPDAVDTRRAHLYHGTFSKPGLPMCRYGWNRKFYGYSIWRGQKGMGICRICLKRAEQGLAGVLNPYDKEESK